MSAPAAVTLHVWGVPGRGVLGAVGRMASHRRLLRRTPGLVFAKLLGTGSGRTFTVGDADPRHWAVLATWASASAARSFEHGPVVRSWDAAADERLRLLLRPVTARGSWSGRVPFGGAGRRPAAAAAPLAVLTRARIRPSRALTFWRAVPAVSADLHRAAGLRLAVGIGEAPVGWQGTFSVWESARALTDFAYRRGPHVTAVRRTGETGWYAEELFARFSVLEMDGEYRGRTP